MLAAIRTRQARSVLPALRSFSTSPASLSDASVPAKSDSQPTSIANPQRAEGAVAQAGVVSGAPGTFPSRCVPPCEGRRGETEYGLGH